MLRQAGFAGNPVAGGFGTRNCCSRVTGGEKGITGRAQVNGRNALSWEEKFAMDAWYVDHQSFRLDVQILLLTVWKILKRENITLPGHATTTAFKGSNNNLNPFNTMENEQ